MKFLIFSIKYLAITIMSHMVTQILQKFFNEFILFCREQNIDMILPGSAGLLLSNLACHSHLIGGAFAAKVYFCCDISLIFCFRLARKLARRRRTNLLLIAVSVIFFTSWFPLNTLNMVMDIFGNQLEAVTKEVDTDGDDDGNSNGNDCDDIRGTETRKGHK